MRFGSVFRCPTCGSKICVPDSYVKRLGLIALGVTGLLSYGVGARSWSILALVAGGFFPVYVVMFGLARRVAPPTLTFSDEYLSDLRKPERED